MSAKLSWDLLLVLFSKTKQETHLSSKCLKKICIERIVNSAGSKQHAFNRGRPSKSILLEQKNKDNVLSNHLFSADFVNRS